MSSMSTGDPPEADDTKTKLEAKLQELLKEKQELDNAQDAAFIDAQIQELRDFINEYVSEFDSLTGDGSKKTDSKSDDGSMDGIVTVNHGGKRTLEDRQLEHQEAAHASANGGNRLLLKFGKSSLVALPPKQNTPTLPPLPDSDEEVDDSKPKAKKRWW